MVVSNFSDSNNTNNTRVLVTGASGYLGIHCVKQLLDAGYIVRGTVRSLSNPKKVEPLRSLPYASERLELVVADLEKPDGWPAAIQDCTYILHTASPFPVNPDETIIKTAVDGTLNVLSAAAKISTVKKIVLTSSCVAIMEGHDDKGTRIFNENDWTVVTPKTNPYHLSKVAAEQAAWNFVKNFGSNDNKFSLTVINPSFIIGPQLSDIEGTSANHIKMFLNHSMPVVPTICIPMVDVRDVALCHIKAMSNSKTDGERIIAASQPSIWMKDVSKALGDEFKPQGYCVPKHKAPDMIIKTAALFSDQAKMISERLNIDCKIDNSKAKNMLNIEFRDPRKSVVEMAYSLIEHGILPKKAGYKGENKKM
jgi:nucleoside-diphosphate-sugar epimerase